ncbi:hypothetical protein SAMN05216275_12249 [Streptosporangium canum]|uniref:Uncharacterized protein n=1 Tax=Streptosporangium canum TaxID=324952 RepID=A0A1I3YJR9_9ACTN|nr:hypothetical protein SAMN05216275_12249 [Streptosporangium canum]
MAGIPVEGIDRERIAGHAMLAWVDGRTAYYEEAP